MDRTMRTAYRKHLARVGEGCGSVICHYSCNLEDGATLVKVTKVVSNSDVSCVLMEGQWVELQLECDKGYEKFCGIVNAEAAISAWESQQGTVMA
jgi:hypothetical protein